MPTGLADLTQIHPISTGIAEYECQRGIQVSHLHQIHVCQGLNSHYFHIIGDKLINSIVGVHISIIRIPIKGGMTIPNIATFDHGTCRFLNLGCLHKVCSMSLLEGFETSPGPNKQVFVLNFAAVYFWGRHKHRKHSQTLGHILYSRHILEGYACDWRVMPCASQSKGHLFWSNLWQRIGLFWEMKIDVGSCWNENTSM